MIFILLYLVLSLSDKTADWQQSGDAGNSREAGRRISGWCHFAEQHLPNGGERIVQCVLECW